tara:strand:- start:3721 stop:4023 length:303 start_codon:yes stop_codon:yes gene_type:complete
LIYTQWYDTLKSLNACKTQGDICGNGVKKWESSMSDAALADAPNTFVRMPSEPPAALVEALSRKVFYNDDAEIGVGLSFICYREIHAFLNSRPPVSLISK